MQAQRELDAAQTSAERNALGQFATPPGLAQSIVRQAVALLPPAEPIRFLDPAFGTGAFFSALRRTADPSRVMSCRGIERDPRIVREAKRLWRGTKLRLRRADFTTLDAPKTDRSKANLLVCNPPYVRHHHLTAIEKKRLRAAALDASGVRLSGLAGLYCYFLTVAHAWLARDGIAAWLIPSEFMDVNYGRAVREYLLDRVTLLRVHRFDAEDVQFGDALVSSAVVYFRHATPAPSNKMRVTSGGSLEQPKHCVLSDVRRLRRAAKWATDMTLARRSHGHDAVLSDLFTIKRGLATGCNEFFVMDAARIATTGIERRFVRPLLPSPRLLPQDEVAADADGEPQIDRPLWLLDCRLTAESANAQNASLRRYLQEGIEQRVHERYLCRHRRPWFAQENRPPAPFLCTYMGRRVRSGSPFRFILNHSRATAANVYLMLYPKPPLADLLHKRPPLKRKIWRALSSITPAALLREGRTYGGGLHKLEPKELGNVTADVLLAVLPKSFSQSR